MLTHDGGVAPVKWRFVQTISSRFAAPCASPRSASAHAPAETFVDTVTRRWFDNWRDYEARYGNPEPMTELEFPRVKSLRQRPRHKAA
ncbi:hypothetical protein [Phenylobacterium immobile]|uniref:hypothetical protein n=1 Tax=Phenylobacterium immobile TaxID=21 RepID=UPI000A4B3172|nr:hypothetical protein [Phenylobacterium immobile]